MSNAKTYYEMFDEFENAENKQAKIAVLHKYGSSDRCLLALLVATFHPEVKFYPVNLERYKPSDAPVGMGYASMSMEIQRLYIFQDPAGQIKDVWRPHNPKFTHLSERRRHELLLQVLESFEKREAEVYMNVLQKDLKVKGLTPKLVREAFPGLIP